VLGQKLSWISEIKTCRGLNGEVRGRDHDRHKKMPSAAGMRPQEPYAPRELTKWILPRQRCFTIKVILDKCGFNEASLFSRSRRHSQIRNLAVEMGIVTTKGGIEWHDAGTDWF
jgi:hypothetical protein